MGGAFSDALGFLIGMIFNLFAMLFAVRFVMQLFRANYYNPLAQFIVKTTDPVLKPLRRIIPSFKTYDTSSILATFAVLCVKLILLKMLSVDVMPAAGKALFSGNHTFASLFLLGFVDLVHMLFNVFIYAMVIQALLSWFPNPSTDPIRNLLSGITEPLLRPIRQRVPPLNGFDLSVLIGIIGLFFLQILVVGTLLSPLVR